MSIDQHDSVAYFNHIASETNRMRKQIYGSIEAAEKLFGETTEIIRWKTVNMTVIEAKVRNMRLSRKDCSALKKKWLETRLFLDNFIMRIRDEFNSMCLEYYRKNTALFGSSKKDFDDEGYIVFHRLY